MMSSTTDHRILIVDDIHDEFRKISGAGIPEVNRGRMFDAVFTTQEVGRGTGQGLAISRSIVVDRHGGTLTFDSEVGSEPHSACACRSPGR